MNDIKIEIKIEIIIIIISFMAVILIFNIPTNEFISCSIIINVFKSRFLLDFNTLKKMGESIFTGILSSSIVALFLSINHYLTKKKELLSVLIKKIKQLISIYYDIPMPNIMISFNDLKIEYYLNHKQHRSNTKCKKKINAFISENENLYDDIKYSNKFKNNKMYTNIIIEYDFYCNKIKEFITTNIGDISSIIDDIYNISLNISNIFNYSLCKKDKFLIELTDKKQCNFLYNEITNINNYKDVINRIYALNNRMKMKLQSLVKDFDLETFIQYYTSIGKDILGIYSSSDYKFPVIINGKRCFYYNKFCWLLGNFVNILSCEINGDIQYDSHRGYGKQFCYVEGGKVYVFRFKEFIDSNLSSIYDFKQNWSICSEYIYESTEIK